MSTITFSVRNSNLLSQFQVSNYEPDSTQIVTLSSGQPVETDPADEPLFGTHIREAVRAVKSLAG